MSNISYDPLRHYSAVKYDNSAGIAAMSNGIQTEAIYETYKLLFNVGTPATKDFMEKHCTYVQHDVRLQYKGLQVHKSASILCSA